MNVMFQVVRVQHVVLKSKLLLNRYSSFFFFKALVGISQLEKNNTGTIIYKQPQLSGTLPT